MLWLTQQKSIYDTSRTTQTQFSWWKMEFFSCRGGRWTLQFFIPFSSNILVTLFSTSCQEMYVFIWQSDSHLKGLLKYEKQLSVKNCDYATKNEEMMDAFVWVKSIEKLMLFNAGQNKKGCDVTSMGICWLCTFLQNSLPSVHSVCACDVNSC